MYAVLSFICLLTPLPNPYLTFHLFSKRCLRLVQKLVSPLPKKTAHTLQRMSFNHSKKYGINILVTMVSREEMVNRPYFSFSQTSREVEEDNQEVKDLVCNSWQMHLTNAPSSDQERGHAPLTSTASQDPGIATMCLSQGEPHPGLSATPVGSVCKPTWLHSEMELPVEDHCEGKSTAPTSTGASEQTKPEVQNCPVYAPSVCHNRALFTSAASRQRIPQQANGSCMGTPPAVQPLLLTGTFPYNMQGIEECRCPAIMLLIALLKLCLVTCCA